MIDIMSALESVRLPLSPVTTLTQTHAYKKPPLSPIRSESSYPSNEAIEVFMPASPTSTLDVCLVFLMDNKTQNEQLEALRDIPSAISFKPIHCENDEESYGGDACSTYTEDDTSVEMEEEEEDDLLGLDLLADDDDEEEEEEEYNNDEMETERTETR
jgi:hypothetical protein